MTTYFRIVLITAQITASFLLSCGGRTFGFAECIDDGDCPARMDCGDDGFCEWSGPDDTGDTDTGDTDTTDSDTGDTDTGDTDTNDTDTNDTDTNDTETTDTDTDTNDTETTDTDTNDTETTDTDTTDTDTSITCPHACLFYITCSSLGGTENPGYSCGADNEVCCSFDTDSGTDSGTDTDTGSDGNCPYLCASAWGCETTYHGTIFWEYTCNSFPNVCCLPGTDTEDTDTTDTETTDTDTDTGDTDTTDSDTVDTDTTDTDTDTGDTDTTDTDTGDTDTTDTYTSCGGSPPVCLQDRSGDFSSAGCCDYWSVAALCPNGEWECPPGYTELSECLNFVPDCPPLPPVGCGFHYPIFYPVGDNPNAVALGYLDSDSYLDAAVTTIFDNGFTILRGRGDGTFETALTVTDAGNSPSAIKLIDQDRNGITDLLISFRDDNQVGLYLGKGNMSYNAPLWIPVHTDPYDLASGDFNGDGVPDFATTSNVWDQARISIRIARVTDGTWMGTFLPLQTRYTDAGPTGIATGDFNGDGDADLAVACGLSNTMNVLFGQGNGSFNTAISMAAGNNPMMVTAWDLDDSGSDDILVGNQFSDTISIWYSNGDGTFEVRDDFAAGNGSRAVEVVRFDPDPLPDLVVTNWQDDSLGLLLGTAAPYGTFVPVDDFFSGDGPSKPAIADLNGDGMPDAVVASRGEDAMAVLIGYCNDPP